MSRLLVVQALASLATGATGAMLVVLAERHLQLGASGFAWLIGAIGLGALLGPLIPNALARDYRDARWLFVPYVVRGIGDVLIAIFTPLPIALFLLFVYGLNTSTGMVVFNSSVQGAVPDAVRGRVFTLLDVTWSAMRLLSLGIGGALVDAIGIEPLFWAGGSLLTLTGVLGLRLLGGYDLRAPTIGNSGSGAGHMGVRTDLNARAATPEDAATIARINNQGIEDRIATGCRRSPSGTSQFRGQICYLSL